MFRTLVMVWSLFGWLLMIASCGATERTVAPTRFPVPTATFSPLSTDKQISAEPTPSPNLPEATLSRLTGEVQVGAVGAHCWLFDGQKTTCTDALPMIAPTNALRISPNERLTFSFPPEFPLSLVTLRVIKWEPIGASSDQAGQMVLAVDAPLEAAGDLEPLSTIEWEAPLKLGEYALDLVSVYENGGHVAYGWHILVE